MPHRKQRQAAEKSGRWAEIIAWLYNSIRGYHCLGRRIRTLFGEIDLIMKRGSRLVFVEVKFRTNSAIDVFENACPLISSVNVLPEVQSGFRDVIHD